MEQVLPPLRKKILKGYLAVVAVFGAAVALLILSSVFVATEITPKAIHRNYDSIEAARKMNQAWNAVHFPSAYPEQPEDAWVRQFDEAIRSGLGNITEPGEGKLAREISGLWDNWKKGARTNAAVRQMNADLEEILRVNEKVMFGYLQEADMVRRLVVIGAVVFSVITLIVTLLIVDSLSVKLASPLKAIAEVLRSKPSPGEKLRLPEPTSLEVRILNEELRSLWETVSSANRLNVEEILRKRNQLETLFSSVEDAVIAVDNRKHVTNVSERMAQLIGLSPENIIGMPWEDLPTGSENYLKLRDAFRERKGEEVVIELQKAGSEARTFEARFRDVLSPANELISTIFLLHDITETRKRERLKAEFIGVLSHELKTPLQSLGTAVELLSQKKESLDERSSFLVETMQNDLAMIRSVANQFLQVGEVRGTAIRVRLEKIKLSEIFPVWLKPLELLASERSVKLQYVKEGSQDIWGLVDPLKFPWVISNLVSNAIRVAPGGSRVVVLLTDKSGYTEIQVTDEGPGIPEEVQKRMFEPYYQGPAGEYCNIPASPGFMGLGLTIAKEITEAHDGKIEYYRLKPAGSCFRVALPASAL